MWGQSLQKVLKEAWSRKTSCLWHGSKFSANSRCSPYAFHLDKKVEVFTAEGLPTTGSLHQIAKEQGELKFRGSARMSWIQSTWICYIQWRCSAHPACPRAFAIFNDAAPAHMHLLYSTFYSLKKKCDTSSDSSLSSSYCRERVGSIHWSPSIC